jgi:hypothetical protein
MVLISAVTPAPDEGSNPAMVRITGGISAMLSDSRQAQDLTTSGTISNIGYWHQEINS